MTTAADLIARSQSHDEITRAPFSAALAAELDGLSDDGAENVAAKEFEYWGSDDAGDWRVHLTVDYAAFADEARTNGDEEQADLCERAEDDSAARSEVWRTLRDAIAAAC